MITGRQRRHLKLICLLALVSSNVLLLALHQQTQQKRQQHTHQLQQALTEKQQQLAQLAKQKQQLEHDLPLLQQFTRSPDIRLDWLSVLSRLQQQYALQFQLATPQTLSPEGQALQLHFTPLQLQLSLAHEQQLLDMLAMLHRDPWFRIQHCQMQRQALLTAPLLIHCHGGWLSLQQQEIST